MINRCNTQDILANIASDEDPWISNLIMINKSCPDDLVLVNTKIINKIESRQILDRHAIFWP